jgi:curved DNA-binding protein CbpA
MKTNYFKACQDLKEVKRRYKELALLHHPDRGGDTATMQEINNQYEQIIKNPFFNFNQETKVDQDDFLIYPELIDQVLKLPGIIVELIGDWLWISGNTYPHKTILKDLGFFFAPKKTMWYYRPPEYKSSKGKPKTIEEIRNKYGSSILSKKIESYQLN